MIEAGATMAHRSGRQPFVVIIDDEDQTAFAESVIDQGVDAAAIGPDDLSPETLDEATTIIVDQYLDRWPGRDAARLPIALQVPDGLSLAAVLRSRIEQSGRHDQARRPPVAFALRTG